MNLQVKNAQATKLQTANATAAALLLDVNTAVACRMIRSSMVPREYFCWLANPSKTKNLPTTARTLHPQVLKSMGELLDPVLEDASPWEVKEARNADQWLTAICQFVSEKYSARGIGFASRLIAMSLLPMYRTLATGKLREGFQQTRFRLTESLCLLSLCDELELPTQGSAWSSCGLVEALELAFRDKKIPMTFLQDNLEINLGSVGELVLRFAGEFDSSQNDFPESIRATIRDTAVEAPTTTEEWAAPDLLWRLSGELISKKSDMVLPRAWIETPVPWTSIGDHWNTLAHALSKLEATAVSGSNKIAASEPVACKTATTDGRSDVLGDAAIEQIDAAVVGTSPDCDVEATASSSADPNASASKAEVAPEGRSDNGTPKAEFDIEQIQDWISEVRGVVDDEQHEEELNSEPMRAPTPIVPKVLIAEIRSHNDPAFVNVLKRQIANCRSEDRTVCLAKVVVHPEDECDRAEVCGVRDNGMTLWQQKLVNWLADRDNVTDPYAFLTSDGELLLCVLDMERNEMTSTLRCGLIEVLTGQHVEDIGETSLAKVHVPARFHAGIASTSSPGSNFSPEQLIEPAIRCLSAASRQGKASIKSIEVF